MEEYQRLSTELNHVMRQIEVVNENVTRMQHEMQEYQATVTRLIHMHAPNEVIKLREIQEAHRDRLTAVSTQILRLIAQCGEKVVNLDVYMDTLTAHVYQQGDHESPLLLSRDQTLLMDVQNPAALTDPRPMGVEGARPLPFFRARDLKSTKILF